MAVLQETQGRWAFSGDHALAWSVVEERAGGYRRIAEPGVLPLWPGAWLDGAEQLSETIAAGVDIYVPFRRAKLSR